MLKGLRQAFSERRLFWQIALLVFVISVLFLTFLFYYFQTTEAATGKGSAINVSGSLRMQSYALALSVAEAPQLNGQKRASTIGAELAEFERRLLSPGLTNSIPQSKSNPLRQTYDSIYQGFYTSVKPLAERVIADPVVSRQFLQRIHSFVKKIDGFVLDLENDLEVRMSVLRGGLFIAMALSIPVGLIVLFFLRQIVLRPIEELTQIAHSVRRGDFSVRSDYLGRNEIGVLSGAVNFMIQDLSRMYASLEDQVNTKTRDLDRRNRTLALLYGLRSDLASPAEPVENLQAALERVRQYFDAQEASLLLHSANEEASARVAATAVDAERQASTAADHELKVLIEAERVYGTVLIKLKRSLDTDDVAELLNNIASIFAARLDAAAKTEEGYALALYEERSTIARELHDSIAQSLAFSKIQLARLSQAIDQGGRAQEVQGIIQELRTGVTLAYRQLREVLTTFRLKPSSNDLRENILQALEVFHERSGIRFKLENSLLGFELSANKQVHLLQIIREALTNVEKHSRATEVWVSLKPTSDGLMQLRITDNGIGFGNLKARHGHFGLGIMGERANVLNGTIEFANHSPQGAVVTLKFPAGI